MGFKNQHCFCTSFQTTNLALLECKVGDSFSTETSISYDHTSSYCALSDHLMFYTAGVATSFVRTIEMGARHFVTAK